jgi:hypothetical protein
MPDVAQLRLYGICLFGAGGLAAGLIGFCAGAIPMSIRRFLFVAAALGLIAVGIGSICWSWFPDLGWSALALCGAVLFVAAARSQRGNAAIRTILGHPRWQWSALAAGCPAIAGALLFLQSPAPQPAVAVAANDSPVVMIPPLRMLPVNIATTDAGNDLALWTTEEPIPPEEELAAAEIHELRKQGLLAGVIRTAPPDRSYNCHGWIFTRNHCYIPDWAVDSILSDNGYTAVDFPAVGDLVIYRNDQGIAFHTAQVRAIDDDGQILLESKWGWMGRYLHRPEQSPYGSKWTFYHSRRHGHVLRNQLDSLPQTSKGGRD